MRKLVTFGVAAAAASQLGSTDCGQVIADPNFNLWCGSALCDWIVDRGSVGEVPTWNAGDPGVAFLGSDTAIYQLSPVTSSDSNANCIDFDVIANISSDAEVDLTLDINGDGSIEYSQRIPTASWKAIAFQLPIQGAYSGIRFELVKQGAGTAVLAKIQAQTGTDCAGLPPIVPAPLGLGAGGCTTGSACASGICYLAAGSGTSFPLSDFTCAACDTSTSCGSGEVCGLGNPISPLLAVPLECVPAAARQLAEECLSDAECASGICTANGCSTCRENNTGCAAGQTCAAEWAGPDAGVAYFGAPWTCSPHARIQPHGAPCASNDDCASGTCTGTPRSVCDDGRACTQAADCPFDTPDTSNGLQNGPCSLVGIQGGTCE